MGSLSDKIGKRKIFIVFGYIIWAFSVAAFSLVNSTLPSSILVIVLDCVMTFFGSTANDAAFNAYVTEKIDQRDRTKTEAVIQILPLCSILIIFGLLDSFTQRGEWPLFFFIVALLMLLSGILSIFLLDNDCGKKKEESTLSCLLFGFRRKTVKDNKNLYITLPAYALSALGMQVFFPYLIIYMSTFSGFESNYNALLAVVIIVSSVITVIASHRLDNRKRPAFSIISLLIMATGLGMMFFARSFLFSLISGTVMMNGYPINYHTLLTSQ